VCERWGKENWYDNQVESTAIAQPDFWVHGVFVFFNSFHFENGISSAEDISTRY